ncbi:ATP-grasp domain-containing protein, partial [Nesterenkonia massiliensis]
SDGKRKIRFDKTRPHLTTSEAVKIEQNKHLTTTRLREAGVPVPDSWIIDPSTDGAEKELLRHAGDAGYPVVLKPLRGSMGRDVYTNLRAPEQLIDTYRYLTQNSTDSKLVLEKHFSGEDYRVLVVGDRVAAACLRKPANVTGNGTSTIQELIDAKNAVRRQNPYLCKKPITPDREVLEYLEKQDYTLTSVPVAGAEIPLRGKANASQGGDSIDKTAEIPDAVKDAAVRAVAAIPGLAIAGVDVLYDVHRTPVEDSFRVIELNSRPEIEINMYPWEGPGQDAPKHILDVFYPDTTRSEDPGITTLALNLEQLLAPLRGASAEQVLVRKKPDHNYPVRIQCRHGLTTPLSADQKNKIYLAARQASVSGRLWAEADTGHIALFGTDDRVQKFIRLAGKQLELDRSTEEPWTGVVTQGFHIDA